MTSAKAWREPRSTGCIVSVNFIWLKMTIKSKRKREIRCFAREENIRMLSLGCVLYEYAR